VSIEAAYLRRKSRSGRDPIDLMFRQQREVADALDRGTKFVALLCGRRSGKTELMVLLAVRYMQRHPRCAIPYIALTRPAAKRILWSKIQEIDSRLGLGLDFNQQELTATAPNGSQLFLIGADRPSEVEKLRGQKFPFAAVDEAASFKPSVLTYLLEDVLEPALLDMDGTVALVGTPSAACIGLFHDVTTKRPAGWHVSHWTVLDNPHLPHAAAWLERKRAQKGWTVDSPTYRREYLGEWVHDESALVYRLSRERNVVASLPDSYHDPRQRKHWAHVFGLDYGYVDATARVCWAFQTRGDDRRVWAVSSWKRTELTPSEAAELVQADYDTYQPVVMVGDTGGLGKGYVEEARRRLGLQIKAAEKRDKAAHIELFNDDLRAGRILLVEPDNREYLEEMTLLQWDMDRVPVDVGGAVRYDDRRVEDSRYERHLCDAGLYGNRACTAYANTATGDRPLSPGEDAFERARVDQREDDARWVQARTIERRANTWWDRD
jgi:hypothetical protein